MDALGYHYIVEASGCNSEILSDPARLREILVNAAKAAGMDVRSIYFYKFSPTGVSGIVIVSESHISIHTWPEHGYAAIDVYVCGSSSNPEKALEEILKKVGAKHAHITEIQRGVKDNDEYTHVIVTWEEEAETG